MTADRIPLTQVVPIAVGTVGTAWELPADGPQWLPCQVSNYIIYCPVAHPHIDHFYLGLLNLDLPTQTINDTPQFLPRHQVGVNFEVRLAACNSQDKVYYNTNPTILLPLLFGAQWYASSQDSAESLLLATVVDVVAGHLPVFPAEGKNEWIMRFGFHPGLCGPVSVADAYRLKSELDDFNKH